MKARVLMLIVGASLGQTTASGQKSFPNIYVHPNPTIHQYETSVAMHPQDVNTILIAAVARQGSTDRFGWYVTTDGGYTWTGRDTLPTHTSLSTYMRDPSAAIDLMGNLFISGFYGNDLFVARSTDLGVSWTQAVYASTSNHERPHMTIDRNPLSPYKNAIYAAYTDLSFTPNVIRFCRSTDQGQSFSSLVPISGTIATSGNVGVNLATGPDGTVYAIWPGYDSPPFISPQPFHIGFNRSTDGGVTWEIAKGIGLINYNGTIPSKPLSFFNCPVMAVDASEGPRKGSLYVVYAETSVVSQDIYLIRSTDQGDSWSAPSRVNQDASGKDHWQPWITVDPASGHIYIVYYDSRNFASNDSAQVYVSCSTDGGNTFADVLVTDSFKPYLVWNAAPVAPSYMGSYIGIVAQDSIVWPVWTDTRFAGHQVYTSKLDFSTSVDEGSDQFPTTFVLGQNYPNPFNPTTVISYRLPVAGNVHLAVYDLLGREVAVLVNEKKGAGTYEVTFDAERLTSGIYFYRLTAGTFSQTRKMALVK